MSSKNETPVLVASLLITLGLFGGGLWWINRTGAIDIGQMLGLSGGSSPTGSSSTPVTGKQLTDIKSVPSGLFSYGGSTTWAPIRRDVDPVIQQAHPAFQLRYTDPVGTPPGSTTGITMLLQGQLSFAQSSRPLTPEERQQAEAEGYTLKQIPVALEGIAIAVHPNLSIDGITVDQLRDIYLGQITNWKQLGGADIPIVPTSRPTAGGTVNFFMDAVLEGQAFANTVATVNTTTEALRFVASNPGAIYYASAPEVVPQCSVKSIAVGQQTNELVPPYVEPYIPQSECRDGNRNQINRVDMRGGTYPITRRLFVIVREDGQLDQQAGEAYANLLLTEEGQERLSEPETGFVAIR